MQKSRAVALNDHTFEAERLGQFNKTIGEAYAKANGKVCKRNENSPKSIGNR